MERASRMKTIQVSFARRYKLNKVLRHVVLLAWAIIVLFPIYWMLITSFKDSGEWVSWPPHWIAEEPTIHNYRQIFSFASSGFAECDKISLRLSAGGDARSEKDGPCGRRG